MVDWHKDIGVTVDPADAEPYTLDFSQYLNVGEQITAAVITITPAGSLVLAGQTLANSNQSVVFGLRGQLADTEYNVAVHITTDHALPDGSFRTVERSINISADNL